ncbi:MAG: peptidylprolyl isomerase [Thermodesulfobacteriota bacterium]
MVQWSQRKGKDKDQPNLAPILKRLCFRIGLALILYFQPLLSYAVVDRIVAIVNQEMITLSEVEKRARPLWEQIQTKDRLQRREEKNEIARKVLEILIEEKLIDQEAKKSGIKVTQNEIDSVIEDIKRKHRVTQEDLEKALAQDGLSFEAYQKEIEKQLLRSKFISVAIKIEHPKGDKELREFYQKNLDRYRTEEVFQPAHILFSVPKGASSEEVRRIRKKCEEVLERIKKGEDFGQMALLYSDDGSAKDRGEMGFFKKGELLPPLEKEMINLKVGEVSKIIRTDFGFHLIKLIDRKGGNPLPFEEVKEKIKEDYMNQEMDKALKQFLKKLKEKSIIEIKI